VNDRRTRILALAAGAVLLYLVLELAYTALWSAPWEKAKQDLAQADAALFRANRLLADEAKVKEEWRKIHGLLEKRPDNVGNHFVGHLESIYSQLGIKPESSSESSSQQNGDFREYVLPLQFKLTWGSFVDLLAALHNSREFLKPLHLSVSSQYEREERLDVSLRVSTIEYAPLPAKPGAK
jgi:hypothetical protein